MSQIGIILSLMNCKNIFFQACFHCKMFITNVSNQAVFGLFTFIFEFSKFFSTYSNNLLGSVLKIIEHSPVYENSIVEHSPVLEFLPF